MKLPGNTIMWNGATIIGSDSIQRDRVRLHRERPQDISLASSLLVGFFGALMRRFDFSSPVTLRGIVSHCSTPSALQCGPGDMMAPLFPEVYLSITWSNASASNLL